MATFCFLSAVLVSLSHSRDALHSAATLLRLPDVGVRHAAAGVLVIKLKKSSKL